GVQTLAGVLLPSATVFLLLLCNDTQVLGPWVNGRWLNLFTSLVIAVLVMMSIVLTASVLYPSITAGTILWILATGTVLAVVVGLGLSVHRRRHPAAAVVRVDKALRASWRMPPLNLLALPELSASRRAGLTVLRTYLFIAMALVVVRVVQLALGH
ncbi:MAG: manganese transporter, partial [Cellulomonas sp.]